MKRIGHKGADLIRPGNTLESFGAAVDAGVEMIELDVLRPKAEFRDGADWRRAAAGPVADGAPPLLVAHDWGDAARRSPMRLDEAMDAFNRPPLDPVAIDCDLKIAGRENEVISALTQRNLIDRASISTMETSSLSALRELDSGVRTGWTVPKVTRDWNSMPWARPLVAGGLISLRGRLPGAGRRGSSAVGGGPAGPLRVRVERDLGLPPGCPPGSGRGVPRPGPGADRLDGRRPPQDA